MSLSCYKAALVDLGIEGSPLCVHQGACIRMNETLTASDHLSKDIGKIHLVDVFHFITSARMMTGPSSHQFKYLLQVLYI